MVASLLQSAGTTTKGALSSWYYAAQTASYVVGMIAAAVAVWTYRANSQRERAKWVVQLYEKFYEDTRYRAVREALDCEVTTPQVGVLVGPGAAPEFTDYLNFFELVCFLKRTKQLRSSDVLTLFDYYLKCLKRHAKVRDYINNRENSFGELKHFLDGIEIQNRI